MGNFPNGPLTGSPLDKPQAAQVGECCPPAAVQSATYQVPAGAASTPIVIDAVQLYKDGALDVTSVEVRQTAATAPGQLPTIIGIGYVQNTEPKLSQVIVDLDTTTSMGGHGFAIVLSNECGCCEIAACSVFPPA